MSNGNQPPGKNVLADLASLVAKGSGVNVDPVALLLQATAMQQQVVQAQQASEARSFTGTAGAGAVTVTMNGRYDLLSITISPNAVNPTTVAGLQQLIVTAVNQAVQQIRKAQVAAIQTVSNGLHIPGII